MEERADEKTSCSASRILDYKNKEPTRYKTRSAYGVLKIGKRQISLQYFCTVNYLSSPYLVIDPAANFRRPISRVHHFQRIGCDIEV